MRITQAGNSGFYATGLAGSSISLGYLGGQNTLHTGYVALALPSVFRI